MNIVQSGSAFQIYKGEDLKTFGTLPVGTYEVSFSKQRGFFLTSHEDLEVNEKIYGSIESRIDKVLKSFELTNRNFGIILSGKKGSGKSLFARQLSKAIKLPVILVTSYIPGISTFLAAIDQSVMVLFDEFDKTFVNTDSNNDRNIVTPQAELLPLFDGINNGKKLFVITCNETSLLNDYIKNRPGRFHYHFNLDILKNESIREYLLDNLNNPTEDVIAKVVNLSIVTPLTYDMLRAISFELNQGYDLEETLEDLNIHQSALLRARIVVKTKSYGDFVKNDVELNLQYDRIMIYLNSLSNVVDELEMSFKTKDIKFKDGQITIDPDDLLLRLNRENDVYKDIEDFKEIGEDELKSLEIIQNNNTYYSGNYRLMF